MCSENSGFSKKPGKRRLARSTQFSRNRAPGPFEPESRAVPPARHPKIRFAADLSAYSPSPAQSNGRAARSVDMRRLTHRRTLWKEPTLAGEREYRGRRRPCQGISKKCEKANSDRPFLGVALHRIRCNFRPPFRAPKAPGQRPPDRPDAPRPGSAPTAFPPYLLEG